MQKLCELHDSVAFTNHFYCYSNKVNQSFSDFIGLGFLQMWCCAPWPNIQSHLSKGHCARGLVVYSDASLQA